MTRSCHSAESFGDGKSEEAGELSRPHVRDTPGATSSRLGKATREHVFHGRAVLPPQCLG